VFHGLGTGGITNETFPPPGQPRADM
jgi:hypothetical protein